MALTKVPNELSSTPSIVDGGNSTAITITSDDNVLAGKTATDYNTAGIEIDGANNRLFVTRAGTPVLINRKSSDGQLVSFYRDTAEVGSIGSNSGYMVIGSPVGTDAHLLIGNGLIHPATSTGGGKDASIDLGGSSNRFKDIYLSGGAYLGGTAAANKLDLYETGTFTPVLKGGTATGSFTAGSGTTAKYVAIGDTVTISIALRNCTLSGASGDIYIDGCPFTLSVGVCYPIGGFMSHNLSFDTAHHQSFYGQSDNIFGMQSRTGTSWTGWPVSNTSGIYLHITMVCTKV